MKDKALLERARAYDAEALGELYDRYAPLVYRYLYRRVRSAQMAEDLTGDVFVRTLEALRDDRLKHDSLRAWLYRVAHNLVVDHFRRTQHVALPDEALVATQDDPASLPEGTLSQWDLHEAISTLTGDQQQVVVLRFGEGFTAREVAKMFGRSVGAIEALQHRALAALRRLLEDG